MDSTQLNITTATTLAVKLSIKQPRIPKKENNKKIHKIFYTQAHLVGGLFVEIYAEVSKLVNNLLLQ